MKHGWEIKKLKDVCEILDSQRKPVTKKDRRQGCYPYYGATGIQDYVDSYIFDGRYLLVGEDGAKWGAYDKTAFIVEGKCWVNNHAHILKLHNNIIDKFAEYYLVFKDLNEFITGAIVQKLTQQALKNIPIPVPPLPEQEKIVAELDCLSGIIEKKKQQLKEFDALAQSIFYEMFGDPIDNEKGFAIKHLGDIANSVNYGTSSPAVEGGKYTYLRMNNLTYNGYLDLTDIKSIDIPEKDLDKYTVRKGDILFNRTNSKELVGKTALFDLENEMIIAGYIIRVRINLNEVIPIYVVRYMNTAFMKSYFVNLCKGAVNQANINSKELKAIPIPVPPLSLQQEFASKIEAIEKQKELIKQSIAETETLFNSRMDYYFN